MDNKKVYLRGVFYAFISYLTWGFFPIYWKQLSHVSPVEILTHRVLWSFVFMLFLSLFWKKEKLLPLFKNKRLILTLFACGTLVTLNWGVYIWAVNNNHILDASLGYYINPLVSILLGTIFFKERFNKIQLLSIILACLGVAYLTFNYGRLPIISIILSLSFAIYGSLKKRLTISSMQSLTIETLLMSPFALTYLIFLFSKGSNSIFNISFSTDILLMCAGIVTALPLYWFGISATKIPLSTNGFLQYITPSCQLLLGIFLFKEHFSEAHIVCFSLIWAGLFLYSLDILKRTWKRKRK